MLELNSDSNGYIENDGYVETAYNLDWEITGFTLLETDGTKNATAVKDSDDNVIAYTYTIDTTIFTYSVDSDSAVTGYKEQFTVTEDGNSFDYTYSYDATGGYLGYSYSDGTQVVSYNADGTMTGITLDNAQLVEVASGGFSYTDASGITTYYDTNDNNKTITGYSTLYEEKDGETVVFSETITYNANWEMTGATTVDGNTTTTYGANWEVLTTSTDFTNSSGTAGTGDDEGLTIYTEINDWGSTKYYMDESTDPDTLVRYEDVYTDTFTYTNWENEEVSTTYTNSQIFKADGTELGDKGSYSETIDGKTYTGSYSTEYIYTDGAISGYKTHNEWNDKWGSGVSDMTFDENWNIKTENSSGTNTWTWTEADGTVHTESNSYENITNEDGTHINKWSELDEDGNELRSHTSYFDAEWKVTKDVDVDGAKTTTTTYNADGTIATQETVTNTTALGDGVAELDADGNETGLTVYTETNEWGDVTKYYMNESTDPDTLVRYEESHSGTWTYTDWQGREVTSANTNFTVFDADGNMIGDYGTNTDTLADGTVVNQNTHRTTNTLDSSGNITGYTTHNEWSDEWGNSGTNDGVFDANWNMISDSGTNTNTWTWTDEDNVEHTETNHNSYSNVTNENGTHTNTHTEYADDGTTVVFSETIEYDSSWNMTSATRVEGAKTTVFDASWNVTGTTTDFTGQTGEEVIEDGVTYTVYTEENEWKDITKYYVGDHDNNVDTADQLIKYEESHSGTWSYEDPERGTVTSTNTNFTVFDANDKIIGDHGTNTETLSDGTVVNQNSYNRTYNEDGTIKTEENISINTDTFTDAAGNTKVNTFKDINITNVDGTHTHIHQDLVPDGDDEDTELDMVSSHTSNFSSDWKLLSDVHVEGAKTTTTTYNDDGSIATQTTTTDTSKLGSGVAELDADGNATGLTVYTETNEWGDVTKYYVDLHTDDNGSDDELIRYEESHSGTHTYEDPDARIVTSTYENTTIFDATDKIIGDYGQNTDTLEDGTVVHHNEHSRTNVYNNDGSLKETIQIDKYENENDSGSSRTVFDADGKMTSQSNSSNNSYTYIDEDGVEVTKYSEDSTTTTFDSNGDMTGYTQSHKDLDVDKNVTMENITEYDVNGNMLNATIIEGALTKYFDSNWNLTSIETDFTGMNGVTTDGITVYTQTGEWGKSLTFFVDESENGTGLIRYEESFSDEHFTNTTIYDASGIMIGDARKEILVNDSESGVFVSSFSSRVSIFNEDGEKTGSNEHIEFIANNEDGDYTKIGNREFDINDHVINGDLKETNIYTENGIEYTKITTSNSTNFDEQNRLSVVSVSTELSHIEEGSKVVDETSNYVDENVYNDDNTISVTRTFEDGTIVTLELNADYDVVSEEKEGVKTDDVDADGNVIGYTITKIMENDGGSTTDIQKYNLDNNLLSTTIVSEYLLPDDYKNTIIDITMFNDDGSYYSRTHITEDRDANNNLVNKMLQEYSASDVMIKEIIVEGIKTTTTTYDSDGTNPVITVTVNTDGITGDSIAYTEINAPVFLVAQTEAELAAGFTQTQPSEVTADTISAEVTALTTLKTDAQTAVTNYEDLLATLATANDAQEDAQTALTTAQENVDGGFTLTTIAGDDATADEIDDEVSTLKTAVTDADGSIGDDGVAVAGDSDSGEAEAYNAFADLVTTLTTAQTSLTTATTAQTDAQSAVDAIDKANIEATLTATTQALETFNTLVQNATDAKTLTAITTELDIDDLNHETNIIYVDANGTIVQEIKINEMTENLPDPDDDNASLVRYITVTNIEDATHNQIFNSNTTVLKDSSDNIVQENMFSNETNFDENGAVEGRISENENYNIVKFENPDGEITQIYMKDSNKTVVDSEGKMLENIDTHTEFDVDGVITYQNVRTTTYNTDETIASVSETGLKTSYEVEFEDGDMISYTVVDEFNNTLNNNFQVVSATGVSTATYVNEASEKVVAWVDDYTKTVVYDDNGSTTTTTNWDERNSDSSGVDVVVKDVNNNIVNNSETETYTEDSVVYTSEKIDNNVYDDTHNLTRSEHTEKRSHVDDKNNVIIDSQRYTVETRTVDENTITITRTDYTNDVFDTPTGEDYTVIFDLDYNLLSENGTRVNTYNNGQIDVKHTSDFSTVLNSEGNRVTTDSWTDVNESDGAILNIGVSTKVEDANYNRIEENGIRAYFDGTVMICQAYSDAFVDGEVVSTTGTNYTYPKDTTIVLDTDGTITATDDNGDSVSPETTITFKDLKGDYTADVDYDVLKPSDLGVDLVILDDTDNAVVIDATDAAIIAANNMMFANWNDAITYQDDFVGDDLLSFTASNFGGISGTIDDTTDNVYAMTGEDFITVFSTNMNQAASSDTISISTLTSSYVSTSAKDVFVVAEAESDLSFTLDSSDVIDLGADTETSWKTDAETADTDVTEAGEWNYTDTTLTYFSENSGDSGQVETMTIKIINGTLTPSEETFYIA